MTQPQRGRTELQSLPEKPWRVVHMVQNGGKQPMERPWPACEFRPTPGPDEDFCHYPSASSLSPSTPPHQLCCGPSLLLYLRGLPQGRPRLSLPTLWGFFPSKFREYLLPCCVCFLTKGRARRRARGSAAA